MPACPALLSPGKHNYFKCDLEPPPKQPNPLSPSYRKSRRRIIHCRKRERLMQFYRRPKGAKCASPDNGLRISAGKTSPKKGRGGRVLEPQLLSVLLKPREPQAAAAGAAGCRNPAIFRHVFQPRLLLLLSRRASGAVASNQNKTLLSWAKRSDKTIVDSPTAWGTPETRCGAQGCPCPLPPRVLLMLY